MGLRVGVLGVGPVGAHIVQILKERNFPADGPVTVMATSRRTEVISGEMIEVQKVGADMFKKLDLVFFAGKEGAKGASMEWADAAVKSGCTVVDNTVVDNGGDLRMHPDIPLVVPEINMDAVTKDNRIICNPNCSTIQMAVALYPLHKAARLRRVVVSTYQSVSGHSGAGMQQLENELRQALAGEPAGEEPSVFPRPVAYNCVPHIDRFEADGCTREELKMVNETRKIFGEPALLISATAVRVPVLVGHAESINAEFVEHMNADKAIDILSDPCLSPGVVCEDGPVGDTRERRYPTQADLERDEWKDSVLVGRIRDDMTAPNCVNLWCVADNLRKGAATNAVQIAEKLLERDML